MRRIAILFVVVLVAASAVSGSGYAEDNPPLTYPGVGEELGGEGAVGGDSPTEPPDEVSPEEEEKEEGNGGSPASESTPAAQPTNPDPPPKGPEPTPPITTVTTTLPVVTQTVPQTTTTAPVQSAVVTGVVTTTPTVAIPTPPRPVVVPDVCVNLPGTKSLPDGWTRTDEGICNSPLPRAGYCHPVNGVWTFRELFVGQHESDPYWVAQGPWREARKDPETGAIDCEFHKSQATIPAALPQAQPVLQPPAKSQPVPPPPKVSAPVATRPIPPPPRASPGPAASPSPAQPAQKSRSIAPPPSAPPAP